MHSSFCLKYLVRVGRLTYQRISITSTNLTYYSADLWKRSKSDKTGKESEFGSSTILLQDGCNVQELPIIVRKVKDILAPFVNKIDCSKEPSSKATGDSDIHRMIKKEFSNCSSSNEVVLLLSKCSSLTPNIAIGAVERFFNLEEIDSINNNVEKVTNFSSADITEKLVNVIIKSDNIYTLIHALKVVSDRNEIYRNQILDEILRRITDNKLTIRQLCDVILFLGQNTHITKFNENIDKLWFGFTEREKEFDKDNLLCCYNILQYLRRSQRIVLSVIEKRTIGLWWQFQSNHVIDILHAVTLNDIYSIKILSVLGRWLNVNIHAVPEEILLEIIAKFAQLKYTDNEIQKALSRYVKAKGVNIKSHLLLTTIMNYCTLFKIRNVIILGGCVEYFIIHGKDLHPMFLKPFLYTFGLLSFHPSNGIKFWEQVEAIFNDNFSKINAEDTVDIMLACIYLEKYPLNFVEKVFNPYFLERVNTSQKRNVLRHKLKLIDTAMTLECKTYHGPLLPKNHRSKSLWLDGRIKRLVNQIKDSLESVAGGADCLSTSVLLPNLFTTELYVVDVMLHPKGLRSSILNLNWSIDRNINVALLINLPEYYCANEETLLGPQMMRERHLRILGFKVVNLKFDTMSKLIMHRKELEQYLIENLKQAKSAV